MRAGGVIVGDSGISARKRLHGLSLALALPLMGTDASAQNHAPDPAGTPIPTDGNVALESLARLSRLPALPAGGSATLERITWAPGAWLNLPADGPVAYFVERGTLDVQIPAGNPGRVVLSGGRDHFATARNGFTRVLTGGSVYSPAGGIEVTRNPSAMPTVALVGRLDPDPNAGAAVVTKEASGEPRGANRRQRRDRFTPPATETEASVESLADLPFAPGLAPDIRVTLGRIAYPPGATYVLGSAAPTILAVEQGAIDLLYQPGQPPGVGFAGIGGMPATTPDGFVRLPAGASVSARDGHLGMTRNSSGAPASLLVVTLTLDDEAAGMPEVSAERAVPGEDQRRHRGRTRNHDMPYATISPRPADAPPWTDLTETGPLPALPAGATAGLRRITLAPGEALAIKYAGPTLYYVEQGTLGVEPDQRQLRLVRVDGAAGTDDLAIAPDGEVPAGIGVYAADGDLGPTRNMGDGDLVILALLIAPPEG